jgi:hypothetical protein
VAFHHDLTGDLNSHPNQNPASEAHFYAKNETTDYDKKEPWHEKKQPWSETKTQSLPTKKARELKLTLFIFRVCVGVADALAIMLFASFIIFVFDTYSTGKFYALFLSVVAATLSYLFDAPLRVETGKTFSLLGKLLAALQRRRS